MAKKKKVDQGGWDKACCVKFGRIGCVPHSHACFRPTFLLLYVSKLIAVVGGILVLVSFLAAGEGVIEALPYAVAHNKALCEATQPVPGFFENIGYNLTICGKEYATDVVVVPDAIWKLSIGQGGAVIHLVEDAPESEDPSATMKPGDSVFHTWDDLASSKDPYMDTIANGNSQACADSSSGLLIAILLGTIFTALDLRTLDPRSKPKLNTPQSKMTAMIGALLPFIFNGSALGGWQDMCLTEYLGNNPTPFENFQMFNYHIGICMMCLWFTIILQIIVFVVNGAIPICDESKPTPEGETAPEETEALAALELETKVEA